MRYILSFGVDMKRDNVGSPLFLRQFARHFFNKYILRYSFDMERDNVVSLSAHCCSYADVTR